MARISAAARNESIAMLRENLKPGDTVFCILRSVSRSGMSRVISFLTIGAYPDGSTKVRQYDYHMARILGEPEAKGQGVKIGGCGMDMGFHSVYSLSRALFPEGFGIPMIREAADAPQFSEEETPKTQEEAARLYEMGYRAKHGRNGDRSGWDTDGGYALRHQWL